ncbi:branched-chain amino acid ABC transporter substrate-binding protein [Aeromonas simiae]|uniref:branched-chain amino acid ABC transporter substrate-binding protein n=1 Tax=Aeromonas simiae TaxID=218936 RepID=UPI0005A82A78|nr:branched-chain amino acid ABC transporter substrate-binding protein [Aeromonas simiae]MDO2949962.1 branched-chain amino acid ABC transporter substrate-binding protein [Aeromonas simiae]MDO2953688.1 branched-chain amino acid ABC transporter substrate-binding protein [Aeromonas simiae]MDO2957319.1 branched-chain amino acid ABC transporter substrate-binding protein [Aeromonas simiae]
MNNWSKSAIRAAISLALFGASSYAMAADTIKIGIAGPVTGAVAQYGDMEFTGGRMAVEQINKAGGIDGKQIEAVIYDDACDPKQAVAIANKVVNDGVKFVVGHLCSDNTLPASDIYEDEGILMITPASTNPKITERGYQLVLRTIGLDSDQGPTAAKYIIETAKPKNVAVIHDKKQYGEGIASSVKAALDKAGVKVVAYEGITAGDKDFSALIAKLQKENVDFVYYGGYHPELGLILRQAAEKGLKAKFMGPEGVGNKDISAIAGQGSEGLLVTLPKKYDLEPANAKLVEAFKAKGQDSSGPFVWTTYAAVQALAAGITKAGDEDPAAVAAALKATPVETVMGPLKWAKNGDLEGFQFGIFEWHADGTSTQLK